MANKWIILRKPDGELQFRMSRAIEFHKELASNQPGYQVLGGGWFHMDTDKKQIVLYGTSEDYGTPDSADVYKAIENSMISDYVDGYAFYITSYSDLSYAMFCTADEEPDLIYEH